MAYKCQICNSNEVDNPGDICELCAIGQDPYAATMTNQTVTNSQKRQIYNNTKNDSTESYTPKSSGNRKVLINGGGDLSNRDPYGNSITPDSSSPSVQVYAPGQVPQAQQPQSVASGNSSAAPTKPAKNQPLTSGITKNISTDNQKKSMIAKWFRALFSGIPFSIGDDVTLFQVFPDYTGTALTALGNACDQVIVYGKVNQGLISDNNEVEVFGRRDSDNNIIAKTIKNKATGATISPTGTIPVGAVWAITVALILLIGGIINALGTVGIVWAIVIVLCFTNLPLVFKIIGLIFGAIFWLIKKLF